MGFSIDDLASAAAVGSSGAVAASRCCVGGGKQGLGGEQALDFTPDEQASQPPDIALRRHISFVPKAAIALSPPGSTDVAYPSSCPAGHAEVAVLSGSDSCVGGLAL